MMNLKKRKAMNKGHILIADDEEDTLLNMRPILEDEGYRVTTAEHGQEALDKILRAENSDNPIELLITDVQMPCLTGPELIKEINRLGIDMAILVMTAYERALAVELIREGRIKCLKKPFGGKELVECVASIFEKRNQAGL
jgi:two-component system response regulator YesN